MEKFIKTLWPKNVEGHFAVWTKSNKASFFFPSDRMQDAVAFMVSASKVDDVYYCVGLFENEPSKGRGTAKDVAFLPCFHADFDLFSEKDAHAQSALPRSFDELNEFLQSTGIPTPSILVNSGNGVHAYWLSDDPLSTSGDQNNVVAGDLSNFQKAIIALAMDARGWKFDNTADLARVLRYPGTSNHKTIPPKPVEIIHQSDVRYSIDELRAWTAIHAPKKRVVSHDLKNTEFNSAHAGFSSVVAGCAWVERCVSVVPLPEPEWHAFASIAGYFGEGEKLFHDVSKADPRYNPVETQKKYENAVNFAKPRTCANIGSELGFGGCATCTFQGKFGSPVSLARLSPNVARLMRSHVFENHAGQYIDLTSGQRFATRAFNDKYRHLTGEQAPHTILARDLLLKKVDTLEYLAGNPALFVADNGRSALNIWSPGPLVPVSGAHEVLTAHLQKLLSDPVAYDHVMNCLAFLVQRPGEKLGHAITIIGVQGTGKSLFFELLKKLVGSENYRPIESEHLTSRWKANMANTQVAVVEELKTFEKMEVYNQLKTWITGRFVTVEEKGLPMFLARTPDVFFAASNHELPINIEDGDRRFFMTRSDMVPQSPEYYSSLASAVESEAGAFLQSLQLRDITAFSPNARPPMTELKETIIGQSRSMVTQEVKALLEERDSAFWSDLVMLQEVRERVNDRMRKMPSPNEISRALRECGAVCLNKPIRIPGNRLVRLWAWRNIEKWLDATPDQARDHWRQVGPAVEMAN